MAQATGLECVLNAANTGTPNCPVAFNRVLGIILLPKGKSYTPAQTATGAAFLAALQADVVNPNKSQRIYPIFGINGFESTGQEATTETSAYGDPRTLLDTKTAFNLTIWEGGACLNKNLMAFSRQGGAYTVMLVDIDGTVAGTQIRSGTNTGYMTGYDMSNLYVPPRTIATADAGESQMVQISLLDGYNQWGRNWAMIKTDNAATDLRGLNDIGLTDITSSITPALPAGSFAIKVTSGCGTQNLIGLYSDRLDNLTQGVIWTTENATDGGAIPISSITVSPDGNYLIFALLTSDPDWVPGEDVRLTMSGVVALDAAGIIGFEANPNSIVLPN